MVRHHFYINLIIKKTVNSNLWISIEMFEGRVEHLDLEPLNSSVESSIMIIPLGAYNKSSIRQTSKGHSSLCRLFFVKYGVCAVQKYGEAEAGRECIQDRPGCPTASFAVQAKRRTAEQAKHRAGYSQQARLGLG
jgi:hypothetical protein